jgi:K+-transporting ATPase A subunit
MLVGLICLYLGASFNPQGQGSATQQGETLFFVGFALFLAGLIILGLPEYRRRTKQPVETPTESEIEKSTKKRNT